MVQMTIFALLYAIFISAPTDAINPRSLNIAFNTSMDVDPKEVVRNFSSIINVARKLFHKLIGRAGEETSELPIRDNHILTDFLHHVGTALLKYNKVDLHNMTRYLNSEVIESTSFQKIFHDDPYSKLQVKDQLRDYILTSSTRLKNRILYALQHEDDDTPVNDAAKDLNKYYYLNDKNDLADILNKLNGPSNNTELEDLVITAVDVVLTRKYSTLHGHDREQAARLATTMAANFEHYYPHEGDEFYVVGSTEEAAETNMNVAQRAVEHKAPEEHESPANDPNASFDKITKNTQESEGDGEFVVENEFSVDVRGPQF